MRVCVCVCVCVLWRTWCWHRNCLQEAAVPGGAPLADALCSLPVCCEAGRHAHTHLHAHTHFREEDPPLGVSLIRQFIEFCQQEPSIKRVSSAVYTQFTKAGQLVNFKDVNK